MVDLNYWPMESNHREKKDREGHLKLFRGGREPRRISLGALQIVATTEANKPFDLDAVAFEEDTFRVLSADPIVREPREHPVRIMTQLIETQPEMPGTVLIKGKHPYRFLAIVHDLNQDPTWKEEWIEKCLEGILFEAERRKLRSLAIPFLGTKHGKLKKEHFLELFWEILKGMSFKHLKRIWLIIPEGTNPDILTSPRPPNDD